MTPDSWSIRCDYRKVNEFGHNRTKLVGRNCLGGGHDNSAGESVEVKKPFDEFKMQIIKTAVLNLYPQQNDAVRRSVWMKCVEKINADVRYLFKASFKKHEWLQLGF